MMFIFCCLFVYFKQFATSKSAVVGLLVMFILCCLCVRFKQFATSAFTFGDIWNLWYLILCISHKKVNWKTEINIALNRYQLLQTKREFVQEAFELQRFTLYVS